MLEIVEGLMSDIYFELVETKQNKWTHDEMVWKARKIHIELM